MSIARGLLGHCPDCDAALSAGDLVAEYREPGEWPVTVAGCPDCEALVHPT